MDMHRTPSASSGELHELGLTAAARAIRNGEVSSEDLIGRLLQRARAHDDLNAFITIDEVAVLEAAGQADRTIQAGRSAPLLGVPLAVKDSYLTKGLTTTFGTSALAAFKPMRDAVAVAALKEAGAIIFGKNNLEEMSYGLTGLRSSRSSPRRTHASTSTRRVTVNSSFAAASICLRRCTRGSYSPSRTFCSISNESKTPW
jgi:Asp-tRNA(Asn)/Glu-tRNA(Gln) amidotransferase A subunit family amidase